jgi:hypothetical protein
MLGCKAHGAAQDRLADLALSKKKPLVVEAGEEGRTAAAQFDALAAQSPPRQGPLPLHDLLAPNGCPNLKGVLPRVGSHRLGGVLHSHDGHLLAAHSTRHYSNPQSVPRAQHEPPAREDAGDHVGLILAED